MRGLLQTSGSIPPEVVRYNLKTPAPSPCAKCLRQVPAPSSCAKPEGGPGGWPSQPAGVIDAVRWYVAPALLGAGAVALAEAGMTTIADALRLQVTAVTLVGDDVRIDARVIRAD